MLFILIFMAFQLINLPKRYPAQAFSVIIYFISQQRLPVRLPESR